jgi:hypothetical protein
MIKKLLKNKSLRQLAVLAPLGMMLTACPSIVTMLPSVMPSMVPSINYNSIDVQNPNQISCNEGDLLSSEYCSIPISRFVAITSSNADPYYGSVLLLYGKDHNFFFDNINKTEILESINVAFIKNYPDTPHFAALPDALQHLYIVTKERDIPEHNYQKLFETYIYLYTINAMDFATNGCDATTQTYLSATSSNYKQQYMLYKAFSMQYTNDILHHISGSLTGKYADEHEIYNAIYAEILKLDPYQLENMAQAIYARTSSNLPDFDDSFYSTGIKFGEIGTFSCTPIGSIWEKFGYEFFGRVVSGLPHYVKFKNKDSFSRYDDTIIPVVDNTQESK